MARLLELRSFHGATPDSGSDILQVPVRFVAADTDSPTTYVADGFKPPLEEGEYIYSYVKNLRVYLQETPAGLVKNVYLFFRQRPLNWRGVEVFIQTSGAYVDPIAQGANPLAGFANNANDYDEEDPIDLNLLLDDGDPPGQYGDWIQLQARVSADAVPGELSALPIVLTWEQWTPM